jgi:hypothetical protein
MISYAVILTAAVPITIAATVKADISFLSNTASAHVFTRSFLAQPAADYVVVYIMAAIKRKTGTKSASKKRKIGTKRAPKKGTPSRIASKRSRAKPTNHRAKRPSKLVISNCTILLTRHPARKGTVTITSKGRLSIVGKGFNRAGARSWTLYTTLNKHMIRINTAKKMMSITRFGHIKMSANQLIKAREFRSIL